ncbi:hypothetical protein HBN50_15660 [Halobacteriovorax sp. GB3]|uniref:hypothetical protein n=1 Tax=Halobacteriovorax sp. GB3 TaxID=2719615 RepID=UPI00235F4550|nr:hypothetical protein [Halobacteriovorax sp. GB3]MDD0854548.1 hypothetical protein [Halobacteriovorax sp. GB3]
MKKLTIVFGLLFTTLSFASNGQVSMEDCTGGFQGARTEGRLSSSANEPAVQNVKEVKEDNKATVRH